MLCGNGPIKVYIPKYISIYNPSCIHHEGQYLQTNQMDIL